MRSIFLHKTNYLNLDQGSIISGCVATGYDDCDVSGCIITARCDLAHQGKVSVVHYLPVVSFSDWYRVYGRDFLYKRWEANIRSKINAIFKESHKGEDVLELNLSYGELNVLANSILNKSNREKAIQSLDGYFKNADLSFSLYLGKDKAVNDFFKSLVKSEKHDFYYIEDWASNKEEALGRVILLKDIKSVSYDIAMQLPGGIEEKDYSKDLLLRNSLAVSPGKTNFYMIEDQIASPFIEHIIQAFSYGFDRVGIDDICVERHIDNIQQFIK